MIYNATGTISLFLPVQTGVTKAGKEWRRASVVLDVKDGNYVDKVCLSAFGNELLEDLAAFQTGDKVQVGFTIKSREWQGKWFSDINLVSIKAADGAKPKAQQVTEPVAIAEAVPDAPDAKEEPSNDDLPF